MPPAKHRPGAVGFVLDREMKILEALCLQHPQHVRKLPARDLKRKVQRRKVLGLEHVARVRKFRFHGSGAS